MTKTWIEQEPGASGVSDAQAIIRKLSGFAAEAWKESGDKDVRIRPFAAQWQSRNVLIVEGAWNAAYLAQMRTIPGSKRRDMADASAGAFNRLVERGGASSPISLPNKGQRTIVTVPEDVYR